MNALYDLNTTSSRSDSGCTDCRVSRVAGQCQGQALLGPALGQRQQVAVALQVLPIIIWQGCTTFTAIKIVTLYAVTLGSS